jgi:hypothetical protein
VRSARDELRRNDTWAGDRKRANDVGVRKKFEESKIPWERRRAESGRS